MALARRSRRERPDYWPGFVDVLSTLLLVFIFMLSVFMLAQFFMTREIAGKDSALTKLNRQIAELTQLLSLEKTGKQGMEEQLASLNASLAEREQENAALRTDIKRMLEGSYGKGSSEENDRRATDYVRLSAEAMAKVEFLNRQISALRAQIAALESALQVSEARDTGNQEKIADLGRRLNLALAQKVQELSRYRSDFFGRLREILSKRPDIRVVGDRFVFQSELFFDAGSAALKPEGRTELDKLGAALLDLEKSIPAEIGWVLRVDGHTDRRPINTREFPSNWELSSARAISVVQYLMARGVSPQRLVAAGFGEFQPIEQGEGDEAWRRNRRIELKLTER